MSRISSDRASLPEILGLAALYFNPEDEEDMAAKIRLVLKNENLRAELIEKGIVKSREYNWWECANKTFNIYRQVLLKAGKNK